MQQGTAEHDTPTAIVAYKCATITFYEIDTKRHKACMYHPSPQHVKPLNKLIVAHKATTLPYMTKCARVVSQAVIVAGTLECIIIHESL